MWALVERGGVWIMTPILALSVAAAAFAIERAVFWLRLARGRDRRKVERFLELVDSGDLAGAAREAQGTRDPVLRVLHCGLVHRNYDVSSALEMAALAELARMERWLPVLDTIVTLAPLLGILGTVVGIIQSFDLLSRDAAVQDPQAVTGGIAQALVTTAAGLVVAIVALVPHNYFKSLADWMAREMEEAATRLEILFRKAGLAEPAPRRKDSERSPARQVPPDGDVRWA